MSALPPVLLVQGAWHHPDSWLPLRGELFLRGVRTLVTELPSAGDAPTGSMHDDAQAIASALERIDGPVVVVAHSYGGIPVTEASALAANVAQLIYLAAYLPEEDESLFTLHGSPEPIDTTGLFPTIEEPRTSLYADLPDAQAAAAEAGLIDQTLLSFTGRVTGAGWRTIPTSYIVTDQDRAIPVEMQERMARAATEVRHLDSSHSPFLSMPARLADLLVELVEDSLADAPVARRR